jgi:hypothetical protein
MRLWLIYSSTPEYERSKTLQQSTPCLIISTYDKTGCVSPKQRTNCLGRRGTHRRWVKDFAYPNATNYPNHGSYSDWHIAAGLQEEREEEPKGVLELVLERLKEIRNLKPNQPRAEYNIKEKAFATTVAETIC